MVRQKGQNFKPFLFMKFAIFFENVIALLLSVHSYEINIKFRVILSARPCKKCSSGHRKPNTFPTYFLEHTAYFLYRNTPGTHRKYKAFYENWKTRLKCCTEPVVFNRGQSSGTCPVGWAGGICPVGWAGTVCTALTSKQ